ncbi:hypothetical protein MOD76_19865 [Bacillus spizizenii]|nr:hypothetical protein [Bacillus spizizenii]MCY8907083.1 hypothetical protein [Bacillus spizizenii]
MRDRLLRLNLQHFAEEGAGGADKADPAATPEGQQQGGQDPQNPSQEGGKTFTQDDVNSIAAREAKAAKENLLKQLGVEDFKNAKEGLAKFKEWQDSQKTEAEKQAERLQEFETQTQTLSSENESLKAQISAMKLGVNADSVPDVVALAKNYVSDEMDLDAAMQKVVEKYPHFKGQQEQSETPSWTTETHKKQQLSELESLEEEMKSAKTLPERIALRNKITALKAKG